MNALPGFVLAGHLSAPQGLGVAARNTLLAIDALGFPCLGVDVPPPAPTSERVAWPRGGGYDRRAPVQCLVNLLHLNPPEVLEVLWEEPRWLDLERRVTACVPFWEFPKLPPAWLDGLACMDVVLAPSRFVERAVRAALPDLPVLHFPQGAWVPRSIAPDRGRFRIPERACAFVTAYDTRSDAARKNPLGALEAFARAFPPERDDVRFVLRIQNARGPSAARGGDEATLRERAARDPRALVVDGAMTHDDLLALVASCDAYVSLHRAEGLGLPPLEAMSLGRPVVATAWSGNLDYMTDEDSLLVPAVETPVRGTAIRAYDPARMGEGQTWGEPDLAVAAAHLRALADDPALRARLGQQAARAAQRQAAASLSAEVLPRLLVMGAKRMRGEPPSPACAEARARVARRRPARRARRRIAHLLRAIGLGPRA